jgi:hypothetical protein
MSRVFTTNSTLGWLTLSKSILRPTRKGGSLGISFRLSRPAYVNATVRTSAGRIVKRLVSRSTEAGGQSLRWNVRSDGGRIVRDGRYLVRVRASNAIGTVALAKPVTVRRRF